MFNIRTLPPMFLFSKFRFVGLYAFYKSYFITSPIHVTPIARIGDHIFGVLLKHLKVQPERSHSYFLVFLKIILYFSFMTVAISFVWQ
jgi:hypothetical protein